LSSEVETCNNRYETFVARKNDKIKQLDLNKTKEGQLREEVDALREEISKIDSDLIPACESELHKIQEQSTNFSKDIQESVEKKAILESDGNVKDVIDRNRDKFGNTDPYKFDSKWAVESVARLKKLKDDIDTLKLKVNDDVQSNISRMKDEISELKSQQKILTKDLIDLKRVIETNEPMKKAELNRAFSQVSADMGKIFKILLKDSDAKLTKIDPDDIMKGLKVNICFNGHWNENLTTLSGGQKSFLVVSLIFAMLKYNPAPI